MGGSTLGQAPNVGFFSEDTSHPRLQTPRQILISSVRRGRLETKQSGTSDSSCWLFLGLSHADDQYCLPKGHGGCFPWAKVRDLPSSKIGVLGCQSSWALSTQVQSSCFQMRKLRLRGAGFPMAIAGLPDSAAGPETTAPHSIGIQGRSPPETAWGPG